MESLVGGLAGLVTGLVGSFIAGIAQITAKRFRNARLVRRGEAPYKDVLFRPLWVLFGICGFIAGICWTWQLSGTWVTGAIAGVGLPALATVVFVAAALSQLRR